MCASIHERDEGGTQTPTWDGLLIYYAPLGEACGDLCRFLLLLETGLRYRKTLPRTDCRSFQCPLRSITP